MNESLLGRLSAQILVGLLVSISVAVALAESRPEPLGIFQDHGDVGTVLHAGSAHFDRAKGEYTVTGSGENMWFGVDDFHFMWKKMSGDVAISATIAIAGDKGNNHRKAVLMIRQSL